MYTPDGTDPHHSTAPTLCTPHGRRTDYPVTLWGDPTLIQNALGLRALNSTDSSCCRTARKVPNYGRPSWFCTARTHGPVIQLPHSRYEPPRLRTVIAGWFPVAHIWIPTADSDPTGRTMPGRSNTRKLHATGVTVELVQFWKDLDPDTYGPRRRPDGLDAFTHLRTLRTFLLQITLRTRAWTHYFPTVTGGSDPDSPVGDPVGRGRAPSWCRERAPLNLPCLNQTPLYRRAFTDLLLLNPRPTPDICTPVLR